VQRTLLFVGAGRHQRRAIERVRELGARVVAVDQNQEAPGFEVADAAEQADFADLESIVDTARKHSVEGVMTFAADRAVPIVAAVAERLGLPGIGSDAAHAFTNKIAMRRLFAEHGVPQPQFAAARTIAEARAALATVGAPAVLKPADSAGQRGIFVVRSLEDVEAHLHAALATSPSRETILETFHPGREVNTLVVARDGDVRVVTASDRLRPEGVGFGVALAHVYPSTLFGDTLAEVERIATAAVHALGMRDGIAYPQLLVTEGGDALVVEVAARIPAGQMVEVPRYGVGVDLVEVAVLQALGEPVPDELIAPRFQQPLAIRFLTAEPGPLPTGVVRSVGPLDKALAFKGVERVEVWIRPGETIRPVQTDGDRRGYVIALGETNVEALERAEAAASLIDVLTE
jgi:biotin carboxylase